MDEAHYAHIDAVMLYIDEARARAERAVAALRSAGADDHLVDALDRAREQLSDARRELMQGTLFAVPRAQASL